MSRFSIIIPVYNVEQYLEECVKNDVPYGQVYDYIVELVSRIK